MRQRAWPTENVFRRLRCPPDPYRLGTGGEPIIGTLTSFYKQEALTELVTCLQNYTRQNILVFLLLESGDTSTEIRL